MALETTSKQNKLLNGRQTIVEILPTTPKQNKLYINRKKTIVTILKTTPNEKRLPTRGKIH